MGLRVRLRVPCGSRFGKGVPGPLWVGLAFGKESGTCERKIKKVECQKAPKKSSWWTTVQRWVTRCGFFRTDSTFHRFGHHSFAILRRHGESAFGQRDLDTIGRQWAAAWRAGPLEPGYGPCALKAVDSFFNVLDHYMPEENKLSLTAVFSRYDPVRTCGCICQREGK